MTHRLFDYSVLVIFQYPVGAGLHCVNNSLNIPWTRERVGGEGGGGGEGCIAQWLWQSPRM